MRLAFEALSPFWIEPNGRRQNLDRDVAAEPRVARAIDLSHPAGAQSADDLVSAERGSDRKRHALLAKTRQGVFIDLSILSSSAIVGRQLAALDSGSRPSRMALVNSTSWRSNAMTPSRGTSRPSLSVMESR